MIKKPVKNQRTDVKGGALLNALHARAEQLGLDRHTLSEAIDVTYPYLRALSNGGRPVSGLSEPKLRKIAEFLDRPFIQVMMLAEIIQPEDFLRPCETDLSELMENVIATMREHPDWQHVAPSEEEWAGLSLNSRIGIAMLWERALGKELLEKAQLLILEREDGQKSAGKDKKSTRSKAKGKSQLNVA